jgi:ribose transport system permease protein
MSTSLLALAGASPAGRISRRVMAIGIAPILIIALVAVMALTEPRFFSRLNVINILRNFSLLSLIALGQTLVMVVGGFDLSVGAVMAIASVAGAMSMAWFAMSVPEAPAVMVCIVGFLAALAAGGVAGLTNGLLVTKLRIAPFMGTLAMMSALFGAALFITKGVPVSGVPSAFVDVIGRGIWFGLPVIFWISAVAILVVWFVMHETPFGRHLYAAGGNSHAARASGVPLGRVVVSAYVISGLLAALVGLLVTARVGSGQPTIGNTSAIESIAAAVLGGVSLRGGEGNVWRVVAAALFLAIMANVLNLARIDSKWQALILGVAVIGAVLVEMRTGKGSHNE